jgi:metal-responsive CopG/Arc/MetJ family transcriptional regulator
MVKYVNISVPKPLYDQLVKALEGSGYRSPSEYIIFLVRKVLPELESENAERRLEALGYKS